MAQDRHAELPVGLKAEHAGMGKAALTISPRRQGGELQSLLEVEQQELELVWPVERGQRMDDDEQHVRLSLSDRSADESVVELLEVVPERKGDGPEAGLADRDQQASLELVVPAGEVGQEIVERERRRRAAPRLCRELGNRRVEDPRIGRGVHGDAELLDACDLRRPTRSHFDEAPEPQDAGCVDPMSGRGGRVMVQDHADATACAALHEAFDHRRASLADPGRVVADHEDPIGLPRLADLALEGTEGLVATRKELGHPGHIMGEPLEGELELALVRHGRADEGDGQAAQLGEGGQRPAQPRVVLMHDQVGRGHAAEEPQDHRADRPHGGGRALWLGCAQHDAPAVEQREDERKADSISVPKARWQDDLADSHAGRRFGRLRRSDLAVRCTGCEPADEGGGDVRVLDRLLVGPRARDRNRSVERGAGVPQARLLPLAGSLALQLPESGDEGRSHFQLARLGCEVSEQLCFSALIPRSSLRGRGRRSIRTSRA